MYILCSLEARENQDDMLPTDRSGCPRTNIARECGAAQDMHNNEYNHKASCMNYLHGTFSCQLVLHHRSAEINDSVSKVSHGIDGDGH